MSNSDRYSFIRVEDFFASIQYAGEWKKVSAVSTVQTKKEVESSKSLALQTTNEFTGKKCTLLLNLISTKSYRFRFNPAAAAQDDYSDYNTRTIVMDSFADTCKNFDDFTLNCEMSNETVTLITTDDQGNRISKFVVNLKPYCITLFMYDTDGNTFQVSKDEEAGLYYKQHTLYEGYDIEYSVILSRFKPYSAKYIGFGEKGGYNLCKNGDQLTYFNYDNMKYSMLYSGGPLNPREPLYHSNPFFMEFYGNPGHDSVCGTFIDNASEAFVDVGLSNSKYFMLGSRYGVFDLYNFVGEKAVDIAGDFTTLVGKSRLKPRFILGYQQGCYGYESFEKFNTGEEYWEYTFDHGQKQLLRKDLKNVVQNYRNARIPLDGLHVDVDIQMNYCTFTQNRYEFPDETFPFLKSQGIKCSTNITPVISYLNRDYTTFQSGAANSCFVANHEIDGSKPVEGHEFYNGGVYYGGTRGTLGHYPDFGNKDVRYWWGQQYKDLFASGLEMVWQDMTTPAIPDPRPGRDGGAGDRIISVGGKDYKISDHITGDMRSFPFKLYLTDNFKKKYADTNPQATAKAPAGKIRNLYSYNLHKATYHGINNLWIINKYTFTNILWPDSSGLKVEDSENIINSLVSARVIELTSGDAEMKLYEVVDADIDFTLDAKYDCVKQQVTDLLKQLVIIKEKRNNKRNFIIGRGGFSGMHRYAGLWTGDNASTWDFLKINVSQVVALGISGQSMAGQDIGGFEGNTENGKWADPELLMRWTMAGAFLPWFRNHYIAKDSKIFQEPYAFQTVIDQIPGEYKFMYQSVLPVCKRYIELRYTLLQLFYDALFENTLTGLPIVRPLFLTCPGDKAVFNDKLAFLSDQFFVRNDMMIAPVLDKQNGKSGVRQIYLPEDSKWYSFKRNFYALDNALNGGITFDYDASINTDMNTDNPHIDFLLPVFVRAGAVIPTLEIEQWVGEKNSKGEANPLTINIYPDPGMEKIADRTEPNYTMYLDDGVSRSSAANTGTGADPMAKDEYREVLITHGYNETGDRIVRVTRGHDNYTPEYENYFFVGILFDKDQMEKYGKMPVKQIQCNGKKASVCNSGNNSDNYNEMNRSSKNAWYFNTDLNIAFVKVFDEKEITIEIKHS